MHVSLSPMDSDAVAVMPTSIARYHRSTGEGAAGEGTAIRFEAAITLTAGPVASSLVRGASSSTSSRALRIPVDTTCGAGGVRQDLARLQPARLPIGNGAATGTYLRAATAPTSASGASAPPREKHQSSKKRSKAA